MIISKSRPVRLSQSGVTVVELLVVVTVSTILIGVFSAFALNYWSNTATLQSDQTTLVTRLNAGDYVREVINSAEGMISQNDLPDSHAEVVDPSDVTGTFWLKIHAIPGTVSIGAPGTITPLLYLSRPSIDTSKNIIMNGTIPYQDNVILYMNGTTKQLMGRVIANPSALNNRAKTTCPPAIATTNCPADTVVADDVAGVVTKYFSRTGVPIDYTSSTDPLTGEYTGPDFPAVEVVELSLQLNKKGQVHNSTDTSNQTVIRVALRN